MLGGGVGRRVVVVVAVDAHAADEGGSAEEQASDSEGDDGADDACDGGTNGVVAGVVAGAGAREDDAEGGAVEAGAEEGCGVAGGAPLGGFVEHDALHHVLEGGPLHVGVRGALVEEGEALELQRGARAVVAEGGIGVGVGARLGVGAVVEVEAHPEVL